MTHATRTLALLLAMLLATITFATNATARTTCEYDAPTENEWGEMTPPYLNCWTNNTHIIQLSRPYIWFRNRGRVIAWDGIPIRLRIGEAPTQNLEITDNDIKTIGTLYWGTLINSTTHDEIVQAMLDRKPIIYKVEDDKETRKITWGPAIPSTTRAITQYRDTYNQPEETDQ